ncbi:MAG: hypothetical protein WC955_03605 [Elusimicrobiota bacterium]
MGEQLGDHGQALVETLFCSIILTYAVLAVLQILISGINVFITTDAGVSYTRCVAVRTDMSGVNSLPVLALLKLPRNVIPVSLNSVEQQCGYGDKTVKLVNTEIKYLEWQPVPFMRAPVVPPEAAFLFPKTYGLTGENVASIPVTLNILKYSMVMPYEQKYFAGTEKREVNE